MRLDRRLETKRAERRRGSLSPTPAISGNASEVDGTRRLQPLATPEMPLDTPPPRDSRLIRGGGKPYSNLGCPPGAAPARRITTGLITSD
jgi:hypothetical protein